MTVENRPARDTGYCMHQSREVMSMGACQGIFCYLLFAISKGLHLVLASMRNFMVTLDCRLSLQ